MVPELRTGGEDKNRVKKPSEPANADASISDATLKSLYITMLRIRRLEEKVADVLSCSDEIVCPVHLYIGQEAVATGVCANLRKEDFAFSTHRSHGHYIAKGGDINALMAELYGKKTGCSGGRGGSMHLVSMDVGFPGSSAIVAGTIPLAVGAALAFSLKGRDNVAVAFFGDGAVDEGAFYESLNFASLKKLPVIFVCENNLYSTHMPIAECLADTSIFEKAAIFNMPGIRIDGNNVREVYGTSGRVIEGARRGEGPALLECMTYRWRGHVGPNYDLGKGLRSKKDLEHWKKRCPVKAMEKCLLDNNIFSEQEKARISREVDEEIEGAFTFAKDSPYPDKDSLLDNVFKI